MESNIRTQLSPTGLDSNDEERYMPTQNSRVIKVHNERQLRVALNNPHLGWKDNRMIQLKEDIVLSATITIGGPVEIEGNCNSTSTSSLCTIRTANRQPLLLISGPASLVQLKNLRFTDGEAPPGMGGAITILNSSKVDIQWCEFSTNSASGDGGAILVTGKSLVNLYKTKVVGNYARGKGGGIHIADGVVYMDSSYVASNSGGMNGGNGICISSCSVLMAKQSLIKNNNLLQKQLEDDNPDSHSGRNGVDIQIMRQEDSDGRIAGVGKLYLSPYNANETLVDGGIVQELTSIALDRHHVQHKVINADFDSMDTRVGRVIQESSTEIKAPAKLPALKTQVGRPFRKLGAFGRGLLQQVPVGARVVTIASESDLANAIRNKERFAVLVSHIILTGEFSSGSSLLPSIKSSLTLAGNCPTPYNGKCLLNAQGQGAIMYADNTGFLPGMELYFENIIFLNGKNPMGSGGAISNSGAMSATFVNCDFVNNEAGSGGAVAFIQGAFSVFNQCTFKNNIAGAAGTGSGTGGAVLLTGSAGFTSCLFEGNSGQNGGAIGVGGSSQGMFFDGCTFNKNEAAIFGNDVYMESWVATIAYFFPFPTSADVYTNPNNIQPLSGMPPMYYPATVTSPPPSPPAPPSPPPPAPPSPPNPNAWIYNEEQLWNALNNGNSTITLAAHIQFSPQGRWSTSPPPPIISEVRIISQCEGFGNMCIIDMSGSQFPLLVVQPQGSIFMQNIRVINAATLQDGGAVQLNNPRSAIFDSCDFLGNYAGKGGAVAVTGGTQVFFKDCNFGMNYADATGGAVYVVGGTVTFQGTSFYLNRASSGGAIGLGPASTAFILDANFTKNQALGKKLWGPDVFFTTPVGSIVYLNQWPPETVAHFFPAQAQIKWFYAPPPSPPLPPSPPPNFRRAPYPPPGVLPPGRVKAPPPSPPSPPPFPPPNPPSPPYDQLIKGAPVIWGGLYLGGALLIIMAALIFCAARSRRFLPRIRNPNELYARLTGEWIASSDDDYSLDDVSGLSGLESEEEEVVASSMMNISAGRRRPATVEASVDDAGSSEQYGQRGSPRHAKRR